MTFYDIRDYISGSVVIKTCDSDEENFEVVFNGEPDDIPDFFDDVEIETIEDE